MVMGFSELGEDTLNVNPIPFKFTVPTLIRYGIPQNNYPVLLNPSRISARGGWAIPNPTRQGMSPSELVFHPRNKNGSGEGESMQVRMAFHTIRKKLFTLLEGGFLRSFLDHLITQTVFVHNQ